MLVLLYNMYVRIVGEGFMPWRTTGVVQASPLHHGRLREALVAMTMSLTGERKRGYSRWIKEQK